MYIGSDLAIKTSGVSKARDGLLFSTSIHKKSVPYSGQYGISIDANPYTIWDVAHNALVNVIKGLGDRCISLDSMYVDYTKRKVYADISYNSSDSESIYGTPEKVNLGVSVNINVSN